MCWQCVLLLLHFTSAVQCYVYSSMRIPRSWTIRSALDSEREPAELSYLVNPIHVPAAVSWLEQRPELPVARMVTLGKKTSKTGMRDEDIETFIRFAQEAIDLGVPFATFWDVSLAAMPSMKQFRRVVAWFDEDDRAERWDRLVSSHYFVLRNPFLRLGIQAFNAIAAAPQPWRIAATDVDAIAFAATVAAKQAPKPSAPAHEPTATVGKLSASADVLVAIPEPASAAAPTAAAPASGSAAASVADVQGRRAPRESLPLRLNGEWYDLDAWRPTRRMASDCLPHQVRSACVARRAPRWHALDRRIRASRRDRCVSRFPLRRGNCDDQASPKAPHAASLAAAALGPDAQLPATS